MSDQSPQKPSKLHPPIWLDSKDRVICGPESREVNELSPAFLLL